VCWAFKLAVFSSETSMGRAPHISHSGRPAASMRGRGSEVFICCAALYIFITTVAAA